MTADVTISCPHCRRQYAMKVDPERLQRLKTRATCGRCGKTFDAATRILAAQQQAPGETKRPPTTPVSETKRTDPKLPQVQATPEAKQMSGMTSPDLRDEMEELAREFAEAAARFTPVGIKRSAVGIGVAIGGTPVALGDAPPTTRPLTVEEPTAPGVVHVSVAAAASATIAAIAAAPIESSLGAEVAAGLDQLSLDAEPASEEEFAAAVPTLSRVPAAPRSWLELSDPGLAGLQSPPAAGAAALEALLHEGESVALPPPPTAS